MQKQIYAIFLADPAKKALRVIPKKIGRLIAVRIEKLAVDPRPYGSVSLKGQQELYRVRQGDYRIIYQIHDKEIQILVVKIGHRRDVYQERS
jgi:mRNA interferase RelE/StbE